MRVYVRLGRHIGVSFPWWLAWAPLLVWLAGLLVAVVIWLPIALVSLIVRETRAPRRRRA